jgi:hypothetical protein
MEQVIVEDVGATLLVVHKTLEDAARRSAPRTVTNDEVTMVAALSGRMNDQGRSQETR